MNCENMLEYLPFRANGTLSEAEAKQVDEHLRSCASCRQELEKTHLAAAIYAAHPSPDQLWQLAAGEPVSPAVSAHATGCASCAEEVAMIRESQKTLADAETKAAPGRVVRGPWLKTPALRFALAAGLALAVLGPVLLMVWKGTDSTTVVASNQLKLEILVSRGTEPEEPTADLSALHQSKGRGTLSLTSSNFADLHDVMVHLYDEQGNQVGMARGSLDTRLGVMQATFDVAKLPVGIIEVEVFTVDEDREPLGSTRFRVEP